MPAEKCRPVDANTTTRASPVASRSRTSAGSSSQKAGTMVFNWSPRLRVTVATPPSIFVSKQVYPSLMDTTVDARPRCDSTEDRSGYCRQQPARTSPQMADDLGSRNAAQPGRVRQIGTLAEPEQHARCVEVAGTCGIDHGF